MHFSSAALVGLLAAIAASSPTARQVNKKPVFAHYMVGEIFEDHVLTDITNAKDLGIDGFAMNFDTIMPYSVRTIDYLFKHAEGKNFKLFFSFDHNHFNNPNQYVDFFNKYKGKEPYYRHNSKPFVSTFGGESISSQQWSDFKNKVGDIVLVPGYERLAASNDFFANRGSIDGVFNWNSWPYSNEGKITVSTREDKVFQSAARSTSKLFMMGISPAQFKYLDEGNNWYRRGENNLEYRFGQALDLQPDMLQLQSWNDGGEGHYMGNLWPEPITTSKRIQALTARYPHQGYWEVLRSFIEAWKRGDRTTANMVPTNGKDIQGTFWHHTLTVDAECGAGKLKKSADITRGAEDAVSGIVLVAKGKTGLVAVVKVGNKELGKVALVPGYNKFKFGGLTTGKVQVEVWRGSTMIGGGYGAVEVMNSATLCNYNFQVVGFPS